MVSALAGWSSATAAGSLWRDGSKSISAGRARRFSKALMRKIYNQI